MIGTIVNTVAIIIGSTIGSFLNKGISEKKKEIMYQALGLCAMAIGISSFVSAMNENTEPVLFIGCMVLGGLLGEMLGLDRRVQKIQKRKSQGEHSLIDGITTASLLFCVGSLSILGPIESAIHGDHMLLFTNAMLDGITSIILASTFGIGIMVTAGILFTWQGVIFLLATILGPFASPELLTQISIIGGLLIMGTGMNILGMVKIKTINLIPAILMPIIYFGIKALIF